MRKGSNSEELVKVDLYVEILRCYSLNRRNSDTERCCTT